MSHESITNHPFHLKSFHPKEIGVLCGTILALLLHYLLRWQTIDGYFYNLWIPDIPLLIIILLGGVPLIYEIIKSLLSRNFGVDLLASIAILTAIYMHEYVAATLLVLMLSGGEVLESYAMRRASSVLALLAERMPHHAHLREAGKIRDIPIHDVQVNDIIVVYPHEVCPVDGIVIEGHGYMDESYLTGEPYKTSKGPGVHVLSGSINEESLLIIKATRRAEDSRYTKIMKIMEESEQKRPHMRRLADQLGTLFTPVALTIAFGIWYLSGDMTRFLAVLVIATPCPLLIAIPISIVSAISLSARRGIIIKDPTILEQLPLCRTAIFDKTGTLTYGQAKLTKIIAPRGKKLSKVDEEIILQSVASVEKYSKHPLAIAILKAAQKAGLATLEAEHISETPGSGLTGMVKDKLIHITNRQNILERYAPLAPFLPNSAPGLECIIMINAEIAAIFQFQDTLRAEGGDFIRHLGPSHLFNKVMIVSGDRSSEVDYLAEKLDIKEAYGNQSPEEKVTLVRQETRLAKTLFVGDGINDAPALASATVGISFGTGSIMSEAGGAVILESSLIKVDELFHISALMRKIALQSAGGGMILSLIGMGFAAAGYIAPVTGALLQEGIDLIAIFNALRLSLLRNVTVISDIDRNGEG